MRQCQIAPVKVDQRLNRARTGSKECIDGRKCIRDFRYGNVSEKLTGQDNQEKDIKDRMPSYSFFFFNSPNGHSIAKTFISIVMFGVRRKK